MNARRRSSLGTGLSPAWSFLPVVLGLLAGHSVLAYPTYHDPGLNDQGYCATCHAGFASGQSGALHALHTGGSDPVTQSCNLCHTGSGRDSPLVMWSAGDSNGNGLGCMGCHGLDYGETIEANYRGFTTSGKHKNSGYGLRRHHAKAGVTVCVTCHANDVEVPPYGENVINTGLGFTVHYYNRADVRLGGNPVHPVTNEDSANDSDSTGLDNDGDSVYDGNDPDGTGAPIRLNLEWTAARLQSFTWPATADGWRLRRRLSLDLDWLDIQVTPVETNGTWRIVRSPAEPIEFYRLFKSQ